MVALPDGLVQAAAEAKCIIAHPGAGSCQDDLTGRKHPECALQAAFAKLPECEAAVALVARHLMPSHFAKQEAWEILDALAREFGDSPADAQLTTKERL